MRVFASQAETVCQGSFSGRSSGHRRQCKNSEVIAAQLLKDQSEHETTNHITLQAMFSRYTSLLFTNQFTGRWKSMVNKDTEKLGI